MYEFKFEGYGKEKCDEYLKRIGAEFDGNVNLENLNMLIRKHQLSVPFENLALCMKWGKVDMNDEELFRKIVTEKRGGFCFELNGAFLLLLKGLGYDAVGCEARVGLPFIGTLMDLDHRAVIVRLDGKKYICDVGMGGPKADCAIEFSDINTDNEKVFSRGLNFWVEDTEEGWKMLRNEGNESDGCVIIFSPIPMLPMDFYARSEYLVNRGNTLFHFERMVNVCREDGYIDVRNNTLKIAENGSVSQRDFEESEFDEILVKYFGMVK